MYRPATLKLIANVVRHNDETVSDNGRRKKKKRKKNFKKGGKSRDAGGVCSADQVKSIQRVGARKVRHV